MLLLGHVHDLLLLVGIGGDVLHVGVGSRRWRAIVHGGDPSGQVMVTVLSLGKDPVLRSDRRREVAVWNGTQVLGFLRSSQAHLRLVGL